MASMTFRAKIRYLAVCLTEMFGAYGSAPVAVGMPALIAVLFWLAPQMRGFFAGTIDGYTVRDGVQYYDNALWHQIGLPIGIFVLALSCWYWSRATWNALARLRDSDRDANPPPAGERWATHVLLCLILLLGLAPALIVTAPAFKDSSWMQAVIIIGPLLLLASTFIYNVTFFDGSRRRKLAFLVPLTLLVTLAICLIAFAGPEVPQAGIILSIVLWLGLVVFIVARRHVSLLQSRTCAGPPLNNYSLTRRMFICAPYGPWMAGALLTLALTSMVIAQAAPDFIESNLHTASAALLGTAAYVTVASIILMVFRDACWSFYRWLGLRPLKARTHGMVSGVLLFLMMPFFGSEIADRLLHVYRVGVPPGMAAVVRPSLPMQLAAKQSAQPGDQVCDRLTTSVPILVAIQGGASRSAAWSLSIIRALDQASNGAFSARLAGLSTVSGGSFGATTYMLARKQLGSKDHFSATSDQFLYTTAALARADLMPALAFRLFSIDLLFGLPTRAWALSKGFENFWSRWSGLKAVEHPTFQEVVASPCSPIVLLNGVDVKTGSRLITSNWTFSDRDPLQGFVTGQDLRNRQEFSAADAVLNSARFPIISPPGEIAPRPDCIAPSCKDDSFWVIDGGIYEASGISTILELGTMLENKQQGAEPLRPLLVVITNDGTEWGESEAVPSMHYGPCDPDAKTKIEAAQLAGHIPVPELLTSLAGLNKTRATRYQAELARARALFCPENEKARLFVFELPKPTADRHPIPMSWALSSSDCEFMLKDARIWPPNLKHLIDFAAALNIKIEAADLEQKFKEDAKACKARPPE